MNSVTDLKIHSLPTFQSDGSLSVLEGNALPFMVKRVFYIYNVVPGEERGKHAHRSCHQLLICTNGSCEVNCDDGLERRAFQLNDPSFTLHIPPGIWAEEKYASMKTTLLVLCNELYDPSDYITDYTEFKRFRSSHI